MPPPERPRLLLVDDDAALLDLLAARLAALDRFDLLAVGRAREALARVSDFQPHLIISDIDMPGMDGGALAAALREREGDNPTPILFLSSMISLAESEAGHGRVGGWPMLSKKTPFEHLTRAIDDVLSGRADAGPGGAA